MTTTFRSLGVSEAVERVLAQRGISEPFPVQEAVLSEALAGRDVVAQAPTGSGKTLAFGIPLVERTPSGRRAPSALVLTPTRELAAQVASELQAIGKARQLSVAVVVGGVGIAGQERAAARAEVIVATPGRLEDLVSRGRVRLGDVSIVVLDEVDRMLDVGFRPAVARLMKLVRAERQTLLFSATLQGAVGELAANLTANPVRVTAPARETTAAPVEHRFVTVAHADKLDSLVELLAGDRDLALVFVRTKRGAARLAERLDRRGIAAEALHGNMSQSQRTRALARFSRGAANTLVATDVAARGLDVDNITHVFNFDLPDDDETYVHRVGRTGRAGRTGTGVTLVLPEERGRVGRMAEMAGVTARCDRTGEEFVAGRGGGSGRTSSSRASSGPRRVSRGPAYRGRPRR